MQKKSLVIKEKVLYDTLGVICDTALVKSVTGMSGLINIKTQKIIGSFDNFSSLNYYDEGLFIQSKTVEEQIDGEKKINIYIRIYDALSEKMLADNWLVINFEASFSKAILKDCKTQQYHFFDISKYRNKDDIFNTGFTDYKELYQYYYESFYALTNGNGKVALYSDNKGFLTDYIYDCIDYQDKDNVVIFTKDGKQLFKSAYNYELESPLFDSVKVDKKDKKTIYGKKDSNIKVYFVDYLNFQLLFETSEYDSLQCVDGHEIIDGSLILESYLSDIPLNYTYIVEKDNKYGIILVSITKQPNEESCQVEMKTLVDPIYDAIEFKDSDFVLKKDNKKGLLVKVRNEFKYLKTEYDAIQILGYGYYALQKDGKWSIFNIIKGEEILNDCEAFEGSASVYIFERNGKKVIFSPLVDNKYNLFGEYDDVKKIGNKYYLIVKNGKQGLIHDMKIVVEPNYKSFDINVLCDNDYDKLDYNHQLYFSLQGDDNQYQLAKYVATSYNTGKNRIEITDKKYQDIQFFNDIMLLKDEIKVYAYDYNNRLLRTFAKNVRVSVSKSKTGSLYMINGVGYSYNDGQLQVVPIEECTFYSAGYESQYGIVVVNSYDQATYEKKCADIDAMSEEEINKVLLAMYDNNPQVQKKYPTLVKKYKQTN